jgi:hypothetical protein
VVAGRGKRRFLAEAGGSRSWQEESLSKKQREAKHMPKHQEGIATLNEGILMKYTIQPEIFQTFNALGLMLKLNSSINPPC